MTGSVDVRRRTPESYAVGTKWRAISGGSRDNGPSVGREVLDMDDERGNRNLPGRQVIRRSERAFLEYDLEGPPQPEMEWLPISYDRKTGQGCYLMRMAPGAVTIPHNHPGMEEFLIVEGELTDSDGTVFRAGDFVSYDGGTWHNSWTGPGCVIVVFEWQRPGRTERRASSGKIG
ncbi:MAG: cupin domain-containing protein [Dongiaceae bacterium]